MIEAIFHYYLKSVDGAQSQEEINEASSKFDDYDEYASEAGEIVEEDDALGACASSCNNLRGRL